MFLIKFVYLLALIVSAAFVILYRDVLAIILFLVLVAIPVMLFLSVLIMRISVKFSVSTKSGVITKGDKGHFVVDIQNRCFLPITKIILYGTYSNSFFDKPDFGEITFWAHPFSKKSYDMDITSEHVGNVTVKFYKAQLFDYFGVFHLPIKVKEEFTYSVVPKLQLADVKLSTNMYTLSESNVFSKHKPGDDPSEVFQIRDYVGGDKLNRIHWKLSSKHDNFIVKDYSLPVSESVLIFIELACDAENRDNLNLIDSVFEVAFALSHMFIERETIHAIAWYNDIAKGISTLNIEDINDLYNAMGIIYNSSRYYSEHYLAQPDIEIQQNISHAIYIAPNIAPKTCDTLSSAISKTCIWNIIDVVDEGVQSDVTPSENYNTITVTPEKIDSCLSNITL